MEPGSYNQVLDGLLSHLKMVTREDGALFLLEMIKRNFYSKKQWLREKDSHSPNYIQREISVSELKPERGMEEQYSS